MAAWSLIPAVNVVMFDLREHTAQMPYNKLTVVDYIVPNNMAANESLVPVSVQGAKDTFPFPLRSLFDLQTVPLVVPGGHIFSQRNTDTHSIVDHILLNDPSLGPVGPDQSLL